jgi:hypothetical protein
LLTAFGAEIETGVLGTVEGLGLELEPSFKTVPDLLVGLGLEGVDTGVLEALSLLGGVTVDTGVLDEDVSTLLTGVEVASSAKAKLGNILPTTTPTIIILLNLLFIYF